MPLGAARITLLAFQPTVDVAAEVIRTKVGVSAVGDAKISTAQSVFGGASAVFDGSGDYLLANNAKADFGTNNFTVECWAYYTGTSGGFRPIIDSRTVAGPSGFFFGINASLQPVYFVDSGSRITSATAITNNTWFHIALVRSNAVSRLYVNGTQVGSDFNDTFNFTNSSFRIGQNYLNTGNWNGHIDEVRISNTARYTANFTPPTAPFINDENTLLLLHMDGTNNSTVFEDDNGVRAKVGLTATGGAVISTTRSKFGGSSWNGSASSTATMLLPQTPYTFGTSDFTIEAWANVEIDFASTGTIIFSLGNSLNDANNFRLTVGAQTNYFGLRLGSTSYETNFIWDLDVWYHLAVVRNNGVVSLYINGVKDTSIGSSGNITFTTDLEERFLGIGRITYASVRAFPGYIDEVRVSNTARYTANFTPPTQPHVNDANTLLLLHMDGTNNSTYFEDDNGVRRKIGISAVGDAKISTAQSQFGGSSAVFDGSGDRIVVNDQTTGPNIIAPLESFTIECWVRFANTSSTRAIVSSYGPFTGSSQSNPGRWSLYRDSSNRIYFFFNGSSNLTLVGSTTISQDTWYHVALTKSEDNNFTLFVNGTLETSQVRTGNLIQSGYVCIGARSDNGSDVLNGHIDELRISNVARYTANFTPPTEPFQNDSNTLLLLHMDGTNNSTTFTDDNGVPPDWDYS